MLLLIAISYCYLVLFVMNLVYYVVVDSDVLPRSVSLFLLLSLVFLLIAMSYCYSPSLCLLSDAVVGIVLDSDSDIPGGVEVIISCCCFFSRPFLYSTIDSKTERVNHFFVIYLIPQKYFHLKKDSLN